MSNINNESHHLTKVWDLPTRIFHWLLVLVFIFAYVSHKLGIDYFIYHVWSGYFLIILMFFRILWGIFGTHHAKFINFIASPKKAIGYLIAIWKNEPRFYSGHNPLGGFMVLFFIISLLIQSLSGLFANDEIMNTGPLYGYVSHEISLWLTALHKALFYWICAAVVIHIVAIFLYRIIKRENLLLAMITGKKIVPFDSNPVTIKNANLWLALFFVILVSAVLAYIISSAPETSLDPGY